VYAIRCLDSDSLLRPTQRRAGSCSELDRAGKSSGRAHGTAAPCRIRDLSALGLRRSSSPLRFRWSSSRVAPRARMHQAEVPLVGRPRRALAGRAAVARRPPAARVEATSTSAWGAARTLPIPARARWIARRSAANIAAKLATAATARSPVRRVPEIGNVKTACASAARAVSAAAVRQLERTSAVPSATTAAAH